MKSRSRLETCNDGFSDLMQAFRDCGRLGEETVRSFSPATFSSAAQKFYAFASLQSKLTFQDVNAPHVLLDLYFRTDHASLEAAICQSTSCTALTRMCKFNISNLAWLLFFIIATVAVHPLSSIYTNLERVKILYSFRILNYLKRRGVRQIHAMAFDAMPQMLLSRILHGEELAFFEYQHGLIYWPNFRKNKLVPTYFVCGSALDARMAQAELGQRDPRLPCEAVKSDVVANYVYGSKQRNSRPLEEWEPTTMVYIHSPLLLDSADMTYVVIDALLETGRSLGISVKVKPHPSSVNALKSKYGTQRVTEEALLGQGILFVGFFSSLLLKLAQEGEFVAQISVAAISDHLVRIEGLELLDPESLIALIEKRRKAEPSRPCGLTLAHQHSFPV